MSNNLVGHMWDNRMIALVTDTLADEFCGTGICL